MDYRLRLDRDSADHRQHHRHSSSRRRLVLARDAGRSHAHHDATTYQNTYLDVVRNLGLRHPQ